ncbi:MAG: hypothetical protein HOE90_19790 [Bacteriovoracaceae bacterium]|jgi:hypothetical protein|nr:hypothetical protein [Bacteriovoracaceae bacterium]
MKCGVSRLTHLYILGLLMIFQMSCQFSAGEGSGDLGETFGGDIVQGALSQPTAYLPGGGSTNIRFSLGDTEQFKSAVLHYSDDGGTTWNLLTKSILVTQTKYTWNPIPSIDSEIVLRLVISYQNGTSASSLKTATIDSTNPVLSWVNEPSGTVGPGVFSLGWSVTELNFDETSSFDLTYSSDNGTSWSALTSVSAVSAQSSYSYNWTYPSSVDSSQMLLRVAMSDLATNAFTKDAAVNFTLDTTAPTINVTGSYGSNKGGDSITINWQATDTHADNTLVYTIEYSANGGTSWSAISPASTLANAINGSLSAQAESISWTVPSIDSTNVKLRVSFTDSYGNIGTDENTTAFTVDSTNPVVSATGIIDNQGTPSDGIITLRDININVTASDAGIGLTHVKVAESVDADCQNDYADSGWVVYSASPTSLPLTTSPVAGNKKICAWGKDSVGNVSTITTNSAAGTSLVDTDSVELSAGTAPSFTALTVDDGGGGTTFALSAPVTVSFTVADGEGLATNAVEIYYSTDNIDFTNLGLAAAGVGDSTTDGSNTTGGSGEILSWTHSTVSFLAPTTAFFRLKLVVTDGNGNTATQYSQLMNTLGWEIYAGNDANGNGDSALSAYIGPFQDKAPDHRIIETSNGDIYISDATYMRKITASTGVIDNYLDTAESAVSGVPGPVSGAKVGIVHGITKDTSDNIYITARSNGNSTLATNMRIYKIDTSADTISEYAGGGSDYLTDTTAANTFIHYTSQLTINPANNDIYFLVVCNAVNSNANTMGYIIRKIAQNGDGSAGTATTAFGDCSDAYPSDGDDPLATGLTNQSWPTTTLFFYSPSNSALYVSNKSGAYDYKLINGVVYKTNGSPQNSYRSMAYSSADGYIYGSRWGAIYKFLPTSSNDYDEVAIQVTKGQRSATAGMISCSDNDVVAAPGTACTNMGHPWTRASGAIGFADGPYNNSPQAARLRYIDSNNKLQTFAGQLAFNGDGGDKLLARFGKVRFLNWKKTTAPNQANLPGGLYWSDGQATVIGRIDPATDIIHNMGGNQIDASLAPTTFGSTQFLGLRHGEMAGGPFAFDNNGLIIFGTSQQLVYKVNADLSISGFLAGASAGLHTASDGDTATDYKPTTYGYYGGWVIDDNGNFYTRSTNTYHRFGGIHRVNGSDGKIYKILGDGATNVVSADSSGTALNTVSAYSGISAIGYASMYLQFDNDATTPRLLFHEKETIRYIENPDSGIPTELGTLLNDTWGGSMGHFLWEESTGKIYYLKSGALRCYDTTFTDGTCNKTSIAFPASLNDTFALYGLTMDESGNIYVLSSSSRLIYKYTP